MLVGVRGVAVNMRSVQAFVSQNGGVAYATSTMAQLGLMRSIAADYMPKVCSVSLSDNRLHADVDGRHRAFAAPDPGVAVVSLTACGQTHRYTGGGGGVVSLPRQRLCRLRHATADLRRWRPGSFGCQKQAGESMSCAAIENEMSWVTQVGTPSCAERANSHSLEHHPIAPGRIILALALECGVEGPEVGCTSIMSTSSLHSPLPTPH